MKSFLPIGLKEIDSKRNECKDGSPIRLEQKGSCTQKWWKQILARPLSKNQYALMEQKRRNKRLSSTKQKRATRQRYTTPLYIAILNDHITSTIGFITISSFEKQSVISMLGELEYY
ncbi:hypothetical protein H5410_032609 [Solanum commersonii]|uniref:Uncharacterized protein n=1 Tax=Solanum commersonii TaxID=4109 RepID=A0A9J5YND5_SOLCO|nr:hypothetical protein H5410_032609 [Solanum commersonii]